MIERYFGWLFCVVGAHDWHYYISWMNDDERRRVCRRDDCPKFQRQIDGYDPDDMTGRAYWEDID